MDDVTTTTAPPRPRAPEPAQSCEQRLPSVAYELSAHQLVTSNGTGAGRDTCWEVRLVMRPDRVIERRVTKDGVLWRPMPETPEAGVIWPAWSPSDSEAGSAGKPLDSLHDYWSTANERLRDTSKWMATVIGAALAALIGTSPLHGMQQHPPTVLTLVLGGSGLAAVSLALLLVLRVMRPVSVSYIDVQRSDRRRSVLRRWTPLYEWKRTIESQQDLYLPCGVRCLTSLRQAMIVEEITLVALALAPERDGDVVGPAKLARSARLRNLKDAACQVATIGEFYRTKCRSSWATYLGGASGMVGTALIVTAFILPPS